MAFALFEKCSSDGFQQGWGQDIPKFTPDDWCEFIILIAILDRAGKIYSGIGLYGHIEREYSDLCRSIPLVLGIEETVRPSHPGESNQQIAHIARRINRSIANDRAEDGARLVMLVPTLNEFIRNKKESEQAEDKNITENFCKGLALTAWHILGFDSLAVRLSLNEMIVGLHYAANARPAARQIPVARSALVH